MSSSNSDQAEKKVVDAFKGFLTRCELTPARNLAVDPAAQGYFQPAALSVDGEPFDIVCPEHLHDRLMLLIDRLFNGKTDERTVQSRIRSITTDWFVNGGDPRDQKQIEQAAQMLLKEISSEIYSYRVYVPVRGLRGEFSTKLELAQCTLYPNSPGSELRRIVERQRQARPYMPQEYFAYFENDISAYFVAPVLAHQGRAFARTTNISERSLDILRLYRGSFYWDIAARPVGARRVDLLSVSPVLQTRLFAVRGDLPIEEQFAGSSVENQLTDSFLLNDEMIEEMNGHGLSNIVRHLTQGPTPSRNDISRRISRAVHWFAKGTTADSAADSFLSYAIASEALLSEGRTGRETYGQRIAALVTRYPNDIADNYWAVFSAAFGNKLRIETARNGRFERIRARTSELFKQRNLIAHGNRQDEEIESGDLLDFETLVRNAILSFATGNWASFEEFKQWVCSIVQSTSLVESPKNVS